MKKLVPKASKKPWDRGWRFGELVYAWNGDGLIIYESDGPGDRWPLLTVEVLDEFQRLWADPNLELRGLLEKQARGEPTYVPEDDDDDA